MITRTEYNQVREKAGRILAKSGVAVRQDEIDGMEVADFGLSEIELSGAQIITLVDNEQLAAKLLVMLPHQTEPEHKHPRLGDYAGKHETIRCEWGLLYLYGPGDVAANPAAQPPAHRKKTYTVWHEFILHPGEQVTFPPGTPHWFQGGPEGCVLWSFSTKATDIADVFTDSDIRRETVIVDVE